MQVLRRGVRVSNVQFRRQSGSKETPTIMPQKMPKKVSPVCQRLNPWLCSKIRAKALAASDVYKRQPWIRSGVETVRSRHKLSCGGPACFTAKQHTNQEQTSDLCATTVESLSLSFAFRQRFCKFTHLQSARAAA